VYPGKITPFTTVRSLHDALVRFDLDQCRHQHLLWRQAGSSVKTFITDGDCAQLGKVLVNEVPRAHPEMRVRISSRCRRV
jgi:hypothetical protein